MADYGFVYVLASESMPGCLKIGQTEKSPRLRAEQLSCSTGVPTPFEVVCYIDVRSPREVERQIHKKLEHLRINDRREFFRHEPTFEALRTVCMFSDKFGAFSASYELIVLEHAAGVEDLWGLPDPWARPGAVVIPAVRRAGGFN